jgi:peptidoglycan/LPS O-acetylase OafA/YrhL
MESLSPPAKPLGHDSYRPDVDGLRALAILAVILFHADLAVSGGFIGVDVFFVISGFLICRLIVKDLAAGTFTFRQFWERRIRRIFPPLVPVVVATLIAGWFLFFPQDFITLAKSAIAQASLVSNVYFRRNTDYFAEDAAVRPLLHTWSLALEEQFYMLFPLLLVFLWRQKKIAPAKAFMCLGVLSLAQCIWSSYTHKYPTAAFYLLPSRAWELLTGVVVALIGSELTRRRSIREAAAWIGMALIFTAAFFYDQWTRFPGVAAVTPVLGTALVIWSSEGQPSSIGKALSIRPLVFIGLISYPLYLWHWPILVFARYTQASSLDASTRVAVLVVSAVIAIMSWKWLETPFRRRVLLRTQPQIFAFFATATAAVLVAGIVVLRAHGFQSRYSPKVLGYMEYANTSLVARGQQHRAFNNDISLENALSGHFAYVGTNIQNQAATLAIWGDSHAMTITPVIDELCRKHGVRAVQATHVSTAPVLDYHSTGLLSLGNDSLKFNQAVFDFLREQHIGTVVLCARWSSYSATDDFDNKLAASIARLRGAGIKIFLVKDVPNFDFDPPRAAALTTMHGGAVETLGLPKQEHQRVTQHLDALFQKMAAAGVTVLDPCPYLLDSKGIYRIERNDELLYVDSHHLSVEGSRLLAPLFEPVVESAGPARYSVRH